MSPTAQTEAADQGSAQSQPVAASKRAVGESAPSAAFTPGPLRVEQPDEWPFDILVVDASGTTVEAYRRYAYGTSQKTVAEVLAGTCFQGDERDQAIAGNARQLADARLRAAGPDLLEACQAFVQAEDALLDELRAAGELPDLSERPWSLVDAMRAAIAKASA